MEPVKFGTRALTNPVCVMQSPALGHAHGAPANVIELMLGQFDCVRAAFVSHWKLVDIEKFDVSRDQSGLLPDFTDPAYVSHFVFWP